MHQDRTIIIYGAGNFGQKLYALLKACGIMPDYFCQTEDIQEEHEICGLPVLSQKRLFESRSTTKRIILIAVGNPETSAQIKIELAEHFLDEAIIYECGNFIRQNQHSIKKPKYCISCASYADSFGDAGVDADLFKIHHVIGGGYRKNVVCPHCYSGDRERWGIYTLQKWTGIFTEKCTVLHFAPESHIQEHIKKNKKCDYYAADIEPGRAMHIVDVTDIPYRDGTFDYIIMHHVLEHIPDEKKATAELKRVLKPSGKLILSFPVCKDTKTLEDPNVKTKEERLLRYGQEDHVRLYGYDYKEKLEAYGLDVEVHSPQDELTPEEIERYGLIADDIQLICRKKEEGS